MLVLPEEAGPQSSVKQPRGKPPVSESSSRMPLETISGAGRTSKREAGVTAAASFGSASKWASSASLERAGKIKGRPKAADENTGEADINPQIFRERNKSKMGEMLIYIRFLFALKDSDPRP